MRVGDLASGLRLSAKQERELLSRMSRSGMIANVRKGLYLFPPRLPLGGIWTPDEATAINALMADRNARYQITGPAVLGRSRVHWPLDTSSALTDRSPDMTNRIPRLLSVALAAAAGWVCTTALAADPNSGKPALVSHVNVVSDKVQDVSSMEAWKKSFLTDKMTDAEKAMAAWKSVVTFTFDTSPAIEMLENENCVRDPIKAFNVYGYGICSDIAGYMESLSRHAGLQARGRALNGHSVPEIFYDDAWHIMDASYINYWPKADGKLASMEDVQKDVAAFLEKNPELKDTKKLREFAAKGGWKNGPDSLSRCPTLNENGVCPEGYHGWWDFFRLYGIGKKNIYEYGAAAGYEVNIQLRPGERLTRNWAHKELYVNMVPPGNKPVITPVGKGVLAFSPGYGDLAPGRIGNGTHEYIVPLDQVSQSALTSENLEAKGTSLVLKDSAKDGVLVIRMPSSYVYLAGQMTLKATAGQGGQVAVEFSDNNGLDWRPVQQAAIAAAGEQTIDLKDLVYRRYDYRLRFTLKGAGTALEALKITHDIQHSQRALPALGAGENKVTFSAGAQEGTITYQASMDPKNKGKQLVLADLHPTLDGLKDAHLRTDTGKGDAVFNITTPGELTRLRFGMNWRARGAGDYYEVLVSFDQGKTFKPVKKLEGPTPGKSDYFVFADVPAGTKDAQVKITGKQQNTIMMFAMRISADYREPNSGFRPVQITYVWDEAGQEKKDVHVAKEPTETYTIKCEAKPALKSVTLELAP